MLLAILSLQFFSSCLSSGTLIILCWSHVLLRTPMSDSAWHSAGQAQNHLVHSRACVKVRIGTLAVYLFKTMRYLAQTYEKIKVPRNMIARVEGRSTYARVGLSMHQTAPWIQPGWSGQIILELMNNGPLSIKLTPTIDRPCQLTFFRLTSELSEEHAYGAKAGDTYQDQVHPLKPKSD